MGKPKYNAKWLYPAVFGVWLIVTTSILIVTLTLEIRAAVRTFNDYTNGIYAHIHSRVQSNAAVLEGFAALIGLIGAGERDMASRYTRQVLSSYPHIHHIEIVQRDALQKSNRTRAAASTPTFRLVQGDRAYVIFLPVIEHEKRQSIIEEDSYQDDLFVALAIKADTLFPLSVLERTDLSLSLHYQGFPAGDSIAAIFSIEAQQKTAVERLLFPALAFRVSLNEPGQPFLLTVKQQLGWRDITTSILGPMGVLALLALGLLLWIARAYHQRETAILRVAIDLAELKQAEKSLREAKQVADHENLQKSKFLATASHDLRQPLQALTLLNAVLSKKVKDQEIRPIIENQGKALHSMGGMLDNLLNISRLEAGTATPEITDFMISDLLENMEVKFRDQAASKGLSLHVVKSNTRIRSDPALLEHIIENLVSNAIKHTDAGKVLIGCRRRKKTILRVEVWDTGKGMSTTQRRAILGEFHQLHKPEQEMSMGLGLGLSIVECLARLLSHSLLVESTPGKGSMFAVEVPISATPESTGDSASVSHATIVLRQHNIDGSNKTRSA